MTQTTHPVDQSTVERDTTVDTTETPTRDAPAREPGAPSRRSRRGLSWLAVGAALAASVGFTVVVLTSGGNSGDRPAVTPTTVNGSDVHLYNQAAEIEARSAVNGSDVHLLQPGRRDRGEVGGQRQRRAPLQPGRRDRAPGRQSTAATCTSTTRPPTSPIAPGRRTAAAGRMPGGWQTRRAFLCAATRPRSGRAARWPSMGISAAPASVVKAARTSCASRRRRSYSSDRGRHTTSRCSASPPPRVRRTGGHLDEGTPTCLDATYGVGLRGLWGAGAALSSWLVALNFEVMGGSGEGSHMLSPGWRGNRRRGASCCVACEAVVVDPKTAEDP